MPRETQKFRLAALGVALAAAGTAVTAQQAGLGPGLRLGVRSAGEDMNSARLRQAAGLAPSRDLLFNGWGLSPTGRHVALQGDMPLKMALSPDGRFLAAVTAGYQGVGLSVMDASGAGTPQFLPLPRAFNGLAWSRDGARLFVAGGSSASLHSFAFAAGKLTASPAVDLAASTSSPSSGAGSSGAGSSGVGASGLPVFLAGLAVHPDSGRLYVCNEGGHEVWEVNPDTLQREAVIAVGTHPHSCLVGANRRYLYVSNWGGRSVSVVDLASRRRVLDIRVGIRPNDMALAPDGRLFVACSGDNTVHVLDTKILEGPQGEPDPSRPPPENAREVIATSLYPASPEGSTPDAVAVAPDGKALYVANADNNAVMAVDISDPIASRVAGFIPVGWYPTALAVSRDSGTLFVANGKGLLSRPNARRAAPPASTSPGAAGAPRAGDRARKFEYIGDMLEGSVSVIARPEAAGLERMTEQVRRNSPFTPALLQRAPLASQSVIPDRVGAPCPIKHVLYIIKENRTYDQVLGDLRDASGRAVGNGDASLTLYGEDVTPNQHEIARETVLLDNLFCNGEVSVDGHSWCDAAIATDFKQRSWIVEYSKHGTLPGNADMDQPTAGFLWDLCRRQGVSFRNYGEGARAVPGTNRGVWPAGRDMNRVDSWIADLKAAEKSGELPQFTIMSLGENHTRGTTPGAFTPAAAVASNDIGLGKIVAAASRSRFWKEMAIFVIEDDSQNGPDHVDAHRTVGSVISPWARRGVVDSTLYTTASMVRTMELILGLPPLTQYDAGATPMFAAFSNRAQLTPYQLRQPKVDVFARNPAHAAGAAASARMNWAEYDRVPEDQLNRILWREAKGPNAPYPAPIHRAVFTRPQRALSTTPAQPR